MFFAPRLRAATLALSAAALLWGCSPEDEAFQDAQRQDTIESYEGYLKTFPENQNLVTVEQRLDDLYYAQAKEKKDQEAYKAYLDRFPQGRHAPEIRGFYEKTFYQEALKADTAEQWDAFITAFPEGNYSRKARSAQEIAAYRSKVDVSDIKVEAVNLAGDRRGEMDGYSVTGKATNTGGKTLSSLTLGVAPKGSKADAKAVVEVGEGLAPGAEAPFSTQLSDTPEGWDGSTVRISVRGVTFVP